MEVEGLLFGNSLAGKGWLVVIPTKALYVLEVTPEF